MNYTYDPNLQERKLPWDPNIPIDFPETDNISTPLNCNARETITWKGIKLTYQYLKTINETQRDEIAKDLLNFFIKYDFQKYRQDKKLLDTNWKSLKDALPLDIKNKGQEKHIDNGSNTGNKIYKQFFPNILKIRTQKRASVYECVTDKESLFEIIRNRVGNTLLYNTKGRPARQWPMTITPAMIIQGAKASGISAMGSIFKPLVAKTIYSHYVKDGQNVLDYSCGFGTRLLGLMSLEKDINYYGYEPNIETYNNIIKMAEYFNFSDKVHIECKGSENGTIKVPIHFAFSSPCYYNSEIYSDEESQCYNRYKDYNIWLENYWRQTIKHIKNILEKDGTFAINIGNNSNNFMKKITKDIMEINEAEGFKLKDVWWMDTHCSHLSNKKQAKILEKPEGIYFYGI